jgi:hypothetical protein
MVSHPSFELNNIDTITQGVPVLALCSILPKKKEVDEYSAVASCSSTSSNMEAGKLKQDLLEQRKGYVWSVLLFSGF